MPLKQVDFPTPLPLFYVGPEIDETSNLPCLIYLALSAKESLQVDPFCQVVTFLNSYPIRVFSVDLPFHGEGMPSSEGITRWAEALEKDEDLLTNFLDDLETSLRILFSQIKPSSIAITGLSRGGFLASHIAARIEEISSLITFAPLTDPSQCLELIPVQESPLLSKLELRYLTPRLASKKIRIYIGNRDQRVHTDSCYAWVRSLVEEAFSQKIRSPQIELFLKPSIGYLGHGTSKESFEEGALWILKQLGL
ncbi:MAG: alpha/beta fold hydrolase [Rhabdochlamydiaceae bacterium]|nr:alpha/beta fold hydrolase [Rhabdochlamydiaceae bacterium]